jgi:hypothetical protein
MTADQGTQQTNGTPTAAAPELLSGPGRVAQAQARIRAGRAETLAALEGGKVTDEPAKPAAPAVEAPKQDAAPAEVEAAPADPEVEVPEVVAETDPESAKRLATIQTAEKRARDKIAKERESLAASKAEIEKERAAIAAERAEMDAYRKARERAKLDPVSALEALGVDDLEYAAKMAYAKSKAATDPAQREAHAREIARREQSGDVETLKREVAELRAERVREREQTALESNWGSYLDHAVKSIGDDAPISKALGAKNPAKLRAEFRATTQRLIEENDGDVPDFEEVISAYESRRRAELEELGVSLPAAGKAATTETKQNTQIADKKHPAKTLGNDLSTPRVPRPAKSDREHRAETLALLESGKLE